MFLLMIKNGNVTQSQNTYNVIHTNFKSHFHRDGMKTNPKLFKLFKDWEKKYHP